MKAATWQGDNRFTLDEVPDPAAGPGQVLVAVHTAGICGTDVHATQGLFPWKPPAGDGPRVHGDRRRRGARGEPASRRARGRLRAQLRVWRVRRVPGPPGEPLPAHLAGRRLRRARGSPRVGGARVPAGLDPATAALTEPAACCLAGLEMFKMPSDATVLVIGGGIMGLLTMVLAKKRGAARAILSDPIAERREIASRLGADHVVDPAREDLRRRVRGADGRPRSGRGLRGGGKARSGGRGHRHGQAHGHRPARRGEPRRVGRCPSTSTTSTIGSCRIQGAYGRGTALPPGSRHPAVARASSRSSRRGSRWSASPRASRMPPPARGEDRHQPRRLRWHRPVALCLDFAGRSR